ncbi:sensor histidine kinase [Bacillus litorisediminis]|uniref:sensor histidine kinase n=1 Tax=Bacillus litorisediminis TaxID=2922713 RepID=UPI001FAF0764|nr:sensor histidine kinase [Bacillus litorisediminis]
MNFFEYIKDKRFFLGFYVMIMIFVSLTMLVSVHSIPIGNILYIHIGCGLLAILYIVLGYFYKRKFYVNLHDMIESGLEDIGSLTPHIQNHQQMLYVELLQKMISNNHAQLQKLYDEKRDQQEFIMAWIHEVKLPIAASRLLMENSEGKSIEYLVDKLEDEMDKIDHYVEQALFQSRTDSFAKDYFITDIPVKQVIHKSVKKYAKLFINKGIRFQMEIAGQVVHSDSKWLGFVVDQILMNSLKYTNEGGEISVRFEEDRKERRLVIKDNGIGITPEDLHRVFEKGFTGTTGRLYGKSTGMGLYLAKKLAAKLGHDLTIESEAGEYTRAIIHFPKIRQYFQFDEH